LRFTSTSLLLTDLQGVLLDSLAEGVVVQDEHDKVLACNEAAPSILGLTRNQLLGLDSMDPRWRAINRDGSPYRWDQHPSVMAFRTGQPQRGVLMGVDRPDGKIAWLSINSEPLRRSGETQPFATVTSFNDITARIEAEDRLQSINDALTGLNAVLEARVAERTADLAAARDAAVQASAAKSEFLSRMSHELRTPLNAILGFTQLMQIQKPKDEAALAAGLKQIERAGWTLLTLIDEVLDLSRIEAGALAISSEPVELNALAQECIELARPAAHAAGVTLALTPNPPVVALADRLRLQQVIGNLISNAVKYNRPGGVVQLCATADREGNEAVLAVRDTGVGFNEAQLAALYQPFNRLGAERSAVPGTGIGLAICKRLVELMQGRIQLTTAAGEGSEFDVALPLAPAADAERPSPATGPTSAVAAVGAAAVAGATQRRILYIEDNSSNRALVMGLVSLRPGYTLETAATGAEGLQQARAHVPDLLLVDLSLPDTDGATLCRTLRAEPRFAHVPIVALTAHAMGEDKARALDAGFDDYLTKPLDVPLLFAVLDRLLPQPKAPAVATPPA
jgi:PAS domain S-box-containing protein